MEQNKKERCYLRTGSGDVQSDGTTTYSSSVSLNEISSGHSKTSSPKQTDSLRNIRQVSVNTIDFVSLQTPQRAVALPSLPAVRTPGATHSMHVMVGGNTKRKTKTSQTAVIDTCKSTGTSAKIVVSTQRNDYGPKKHDVVLKKLLLEDQECNKLLFGIKESKRQRQMKVEEQQKKLEEARKYQKELISRKAIQTKKINALKKVGRGVPMHAAQEDVLRYQMLMDQEKIQRGKIKLLEAELSALTGLPLRCKPTIQRPKPASRNPSLDFRNLEIDSLPSVGVQGNTCNTLTRHSANVKNPDEVFYSYPESSASVRQVPPLDLSKLLDDSLPAVRKKPTVPVVCGEKGKKKIASGKCAQQKMTKDLDKITRAVVLPDIKDNTCNKSFIPNIFNCKSIL